MRLIIIIALASLAGFGLLQIETLFPNNYVKMYLGNYVVELKVVQLLILLLLLAVLFYFLVWLFRSVWRSPKSVSRWWHRRSRNIAEEQFGAGYLSLIKGDWRRAEGQLTKKTNHSHISFVNYLAAARAAAEQGKLQKRDEYLQAAYESAPKERLAIGLTKARLHESAGQLEQAEATLADLAELGADNPQYTAMSLQLFENGQNWVGVESMLPAARKQKALPSTTLDELEDAIVTNRLTSAEDRVAAFKALPRGQRKRLSNIQVYAQTLVAEGDDISAEKAIRSALKSDWSTELVDIYGQLNTDKPAKLLRQVEGWLLARPEDPNLNLAAGRLAKQAKLYDAAKQFLQAAITHGQLPAAYSVLGEVYEANNESGKALQLYRNGMQALASSDLSSGFVEEQPADVELISAESSKEFPASS